MEDERLGLRPAEAAVRPDELLERRDLAERRVVLADQQQVRRVLHLVLAPHAQQGVRPERRHRVLALDLAVVEVDDPVVADDHRPSITRLDQQHRDARMGGQRRDQARDARSSSSSSVSRWSLPVNQIRPRLPGPDDRDRRRVRGRRHVVLLDVDHPVLGRAPGERRPRHRRPDALGPRDLGQERVDERAALGGGRRLDHRRAAAHQVEDHLAQALAVALLERGAQALAVVRQDDELVRPRRVGGGLLERREGAVDAVERLERLHALGPAVVGELVVVGEVGVDHVGAAVHLVDDQRDVDVAEQHVAGGPHARVLEAAMHLRHDARAPRPPRLVALLDELAQEQRERPEVPGRAEEEAHERLALAEAPRALRERRRREVGPRRVAGHEVADADAVVRQQALAVRHPAHDLGGVGRVARDHQPLAVPLVPAEGRDAVVVAVEDAGLAGRRHRRQDRLPLGERCGSRRGSSGPSC